MITKNPISARELCKKSVTAEIQNKVYITNKLEEKFHKEITNMMHMGLYHVEIPLESQELNVLDRVTEKLRELGYRFCLIEHRVIDNVNEETSLTHLMRVSVAHLKNERGE